ncbi:LysR family transcriptional regulator [Mesorhizobium sp. M1C.F.Ca.ET.193.01.1.1]|uniref:LysR family transcriptional regulator n=1 Tax=unclassified Mesorhizobium TaxID=325217 RepID=UPI000FD4E797|nr:MULTISPECIES: LysR family transcriptional regulator [unclassified Mesorhizobium]TGS91626.1 LysR family transcriptional regulator [bacterium M00.F.Ca.ET.177.01.1.1]TGQ49857.1 LysR family transcriptional regulator [Mesorhizobium sp. M1C.F.Ca.ET.210.01.1.1]TGQ64321.1 LysR family transcriptional regulator [Mesorhizobium sp. M1C.F.Ca.ET.212.01.1.1]TGQ98057.1 LysR family transcriptional regulator [Mesorhizobium sp. M1C.F.Ca.ET.204.01.1.1]TGR18281.1 LysR family transcriptional regulator [Mesorhizo
MHPRLLKTFLAVARTRNVTRAAAEVNLAQSSVSDQIQALEAELGASLFTRSRQGLELTPAGEALKPYAEELLVLTDEAQAAVDATTGKTAGRLAIGALETIASARLPAWLADFRAAHSGIDIRLRIAGSGELLRRLGDGEIDVAFCFDRPGASEPKERFARRTVVTEPMVLIAPPGENRANVDLAELAEKRFVATETGCVYRAMVDRAFAEAGLGGPKLAAEVGSIDAIAGLVAAGAGFGIVPRLAVATAIDRGEVAELAWPGPVRSVVLVMIWRRRRVQPPALKALLASADAGFAPVRPADARPRHAVSFPS